MYKTAALVFIVQNVKNNMKNILTLLLFSCLVFSCLHKVSKQDGNFGFDVSQEFVQGSEDIPLLEGMEKIADDSSLGFDSNAGSVINSTYGTKIGLKKTKEFYLKILPKMGWVITSNSHDCAEFKRENEKLEVILEDEGGVHMVRFFISSGI